MGGRWAAIFLLAASLATWPVRVAADNAAVDVQAKLVEDARALNRSMESDFRAMVEPYMENLKALKPEVMETIVMHQWWGLARELVEKSHTQGVDMSFAVRKATRVLKDEAEELLRALNPKYGQAQQVAPAFQWAQNDTSVVLTVKYTVRWNAPGALEVTEPSVNMTGNVFNFTGLGKHSNNKYKYFLSLFLFDNINAEMSSWSAASVGKLSVTLRKKWPRKWPRLLANKKSKIQNMHLWSERQEALESTLGGMSAVANSAVTCRATGTLYCLSTDTCKKPDSCATCPGKTIPKPEENLCAGMPSDKASLSFKDADTDEHEVGGEIKITKARNDFDIDTYTVYWGKDDKHKLDFSVTEGPIEPKIGSAEAIGVDTEVKIPMNTAFPGDATHLLVFSTNALGEFATPGSVLLTDVILPKGKPSSVSFEDDDGDESRVSGTVTIGRADDERWVDEYALHWGKSQNRKINSGSLIRDVKKVADKDLTHHIHKGTNIPDGAAYILAFAKNSHGEFPQPARVKIVDGLKPCLKDGAQDCPGGITASEDLDPDEGQAHVKVSLKPAAAEDGLTQYSIYWGLGSCDALGEQKNKVGHQALQVGHIKDANVGETEDIEIGPDVEVPGKATHLLVFTRNKLGESKLCSSVPFQDSKEKKEL